MTGGDDPFDKVYNWIRGLISKSEPTLPIQVNTPDGVILLKATEVNKDRSNYGANCHSYPVLVLEAAEVVHVDNEQGVQQ